MIINKIKNKFQQLEDKIKVNELILLDQLALVQLLKMFKENMFFPLTDWSISPREVLHICNDIVINERKCIVEFGSGFSTLCIAQLLKLNNSKTHFITVENDKDWLLKLKNLIDKLELSNFVKCIYSPISKVKEEISMSRQDKWYDISFLDEEIKKIDNIDLLIVDGPFGGTTPYARYSAVPYLKNKFNDNFAVFLDDSSRLEESEIVGLWKEILNCRSVDMTRYSILSNSNRFNTTPINNSNI